jgi:hypothetical protein
MSVMLRYENVPHFCFMCGRLGHGAANCDEEEGVQGGIQFGEDLRASPPKRVREIRLTHASSKATCPLFQVGSYPSSQSSVGSNAESGSKGKHANQDSQPHGKMADLTDSDEFVRSVKGMHVSSRGEEEV